MTLKSPLGMCVGPGGVVYVADVGVKKVVAFGAVGKLVAVYGKEGELQNPTDAAVSPDGRRLFVTDSKAQQVVVFDRAGGQRLSAFGRLGSGDGEFSFPSALAFDKQGRLLVIDPINARVQIFDAGGGYLGHSEGWERRSRASFGPRTWPSACKASST